MVIITIIDFDFAVIIIAAEIKFDLPIGIVAIFITIAVIMMCTKSTIMNCV